MPNWFWILVMIVGVLAVGMLRERLRMDDMEGFAAQRGFVLHSPFAPGERPPIAVLAERLEGRPATRWGAGLTGVVDGIEIVIAEHEMARSSKAPGTWHVLLAWRVAAAGGKGEQRPDSGHPWPYGGQLIRDGAWAAWRLPGNLTKANVETLLAHLPEAGRRF